MILDPFSTCVVFSLTVYFDRYAPKYQSYVKPELISDSDFYVCVCV